MRALLFICILLTSFTFVQTVTAKELKIGVVDIQKILEESPQAEAARNTLQSEFAPRDEELKNNQEKIRKLEEQLARDGAIMSESERSKLEPKY